MSRTTPQTQHLSFLFQQLRQHEAHSKRIFCQKTINFLRPSKSRPLLLKMPLPGSIEHSDGSEGVMESAAANLDLASNPFCRKLMNLKAVPEQL